MRTTRSTASLGLLAAALISSAGCGDSPPGSAAKADGPRATADGGLSGSATFHGTVLEPMATGSVPAAGAEVTVSVDENGDGVFSADEAHATSADATGGYRVEVPLGRKAVVMVTFRAPGFLPVHRTQKAAAGADVRLDATLSSGLALQRMGDAFVAPAGPRLVIKNLAGNIASGRARVYNPATEARAFPGQFRDESGAFLRSAVFANVELLDASGVEVHTLSQAATLEMEVPRERWSVLRDTTPGDDRIQVPYYSFDVTKGVWHREPGDAHLVDGNGAVISESHAAAVLAGTYAGRVVARLQVMHFSPVNIDDPCKGGNALDKWLCKTTPVGGIHSALGGGKRTLAADGGVSAGTPVVGAYYDITIRTASGFDLGHISGTTDADGGYGIDTPGPGSEPAGMDLDGNGIAGELVFYAVEVWWQGKAYKSAPIQAPSDGSDIDLSLVLGPETEVKCAVCRISGTARDLLGRPLAADVRVEAGPYAFEHSGSLCPDSAPCEWSTIAGADGAFSLRVPVCDEGLSLFTSYSAEPTPGHHVERSGGSQAPSCPTSQVSLVLDGGGDAYDLAITRQGDALSWTPAFPVDRLLVISAAGETKWAIDAQSVDFSGTAFPGPVTYGVVPAGTTQTAPDSGSPAPLAAGDFIEVRGDSMDASGYYVFGDGSITLP